MLKNHVIMTHMFWCVSQKLGSHILTGNQKKEKTQGCNPEPLKDINRVIAQKTHICCFTGNLSQLSYKQNVLQWIKERSNDYWQKKGLHCPTPELGFHPWCITLPWAPEGSWPQVPPLQASWLVTSPAGGVISYPSLCILLVRADPSRGLSNRGSSHFASPP